MSNRNGAVERVAAPNLPVPSHIGQATAVEQSRAVAEVQAAIVVAQQNPRNVTAAIAAMEQSCQRKALADRAFYSYSRGGGAVTGPSVKLARELARCWGNIQYGIAELRRDDDYGQSEMQAYAWDVQTNTRSAQVFIVPHKRDTKGGAKDLVDLRDIYENNANNGARRLREAIFAVLPQWFTEDAIELCHKTLRHGDGEPLDKRITKAIQGFELRFQVSERQLAQRLGRRREQWNDADVAQLGVLFKSLDRGEVTVDEAFPTLDAAVTVAEITEPTGKTSAPEGDDWPEMPQPGGAS